MPAIDNYLLFGYSGGHYMVTFEMTIIENERGAYIRNSEMLFYMPDYINTETFKTLN